MGPVNAIWFWFELPAGHRLLRWHLNHTLDHIVSQRGIRWISYIMTFDQVKVFVRMFKVNLPVNFEHCDSVDYWLWAPTLDRGAEEMSVSESIGLLVKHGAFRSICVNRQLLHPRDEGSFTVWSNWLNRWSSYFYWLLRLLIRVVCFLGRFWVCCSCCISWRSICFSLIVLLLSLLGLFLRLGWFLFWFRLLLRVLFLLWLCLGFLFILRFLLGLFLWWFLLCDRVRLLFLISRFNF